MCFALVQWESFQCHEGGCAFKWAFNIEYACSNSIKTTVKKMDCWELHSITYVSDTLWFYLITTNYLAKVAVNKCTDLYASISLIIVMLTKCSKKLMPVILISTTHIILIPFEVEEKMLMVLPKLKFKDNKETAT